MAPSGAPVRAFLEICSGDVEGYGALQQRYLATQSHITKIGPQYGWDVADLKPEDLDEEQRDVLASDPSLSSTLLFDKPKPISLGHLTLELNPSANLSRTRENFVALLEGSKGFSKADRNKKLHYAGCNVHRIETGFCLQSGDVTRGDGSGGEAATSGTIKAEAEGLSIKPVYGSLCMASGTRKDSISSQFFIVLATQEKELAKLGPRKYVTFGNVLLDDSSQGQEGAAVLTQVESLGTSTGTPVQKVWIGDCGLSKA
ncbi:hypothetical protein OC861_002701 [Tilletia horrida]|nr:hypothetical protein OC861_002701 [Tilletia horrida]